MAYHITSIVLAPPLIVVPLGAAPLVPPLIFQVLIRESHIIGWCAPGMLLGLLMQTVAVLPAGGSHSRSYNSRVRSTNPALLMELWVSLSILRLQWGASSRAVSYEYCLVTLATCNDASTWISTGTSVGVTLVGSIPERLTIGRFALGMPWE